MPKSIRAKSTVRKPLRDISNGGKPSRTCKESAAPAGGACDAGAALDGLLLARSNLADLINQIDELVAHAIDHKTSKKGNEVIQSFSDVLADMHSSLQPWIPRLQQIFGNTTTASLAHSRQPKDTNLTCATGDVDAVNEDEPELDLIVSPSPLVSWHAGACKVESARQLFMLTPLPKSKVLASKQLASLKKGVEISNDKDPPHDTYALPPLLATSRSVRDDLLDRREVKPPASSIVPKPCRIQSKSKSDGWLVSPMNFTVHNSKENSVYLLTPCPKTMISKSYASINKVTDCNEQENKNIPKGPKPTQRESELKVSDDDSIEEVSKNLASRYQQLIGLLPTDKFTSHRREVDGTLDWFLSPPKSCILMEPSDEKVLQSPHVFPMPGKGALLATPMWKDFESTVRKGKQPGETTLKKELWTKFEAVSMSGLHFDASVFQDTSKKGFLDMLEEASSEPTDLDSEVGR